MKPILAAAGTGLAGSAGGALASGGLSLTTLGLVTGVSCLFGMLSSASRLGAPIGRGALRAVLMNGGAVWVASFSLASLSHAGLPTAALLGLGVGLAGTKALELIEGGVLRAMGKQPVTKAELEKAISQAVGDARNDAAAAFAEINVKTRRRVQQREADDDAHDT